MSANVILAGAVGLVLQASVAVQGAEPLVPAPATVEPVVAPAPIEAQSPTTPQPNPDAPTAIYVVRSELPAFTAMRAGTAALGILGAAAQISEGKKVLQENDLVDPANMISAEIAKVFAEKKGAVLSETPLVIGGERTDLLKANTGKARYVVYVGTIMWSYIYYPTDWAHYGVTYISRVQILDSTTGKAVLATNCTSKSPKSPESPDYEQLMANRATKLKELIEIAGQACLAEFKTKVAAI